MSVFSNCFSAINISFLWEYINLAHATDDGYIWNERVRQHACLPECLLQYVWMVKSEVRRSMSLDKVLYPIYLVSDTTLFIIAPLKTWNYRVIINTVWALHDFIIFFNTNSCSFNSFIVFIALTLQPTAASLELCRPCWFWSVLRLLNRHRLLQVALLTRVLLNIINSLYLTLYYRSFV